MVSTILAVLSEAFHTVIGLDGGDGVGAGVGGGDGTEPIVVIMIVDIGGTVNDVKLVVGIVVVKPLTCAEDCSQ